MHLQLRLTLVLVAAIAVAGCNAIRPGSVQRDRLDDAAAISESWKEQALLNIVKLRYFDTPVFLDVASVISSYTLQSQVDIAARIFPDSRTDSFRNFGASGLYTDRPAISYAPVAGEKYVANLLRPAATSCDRSANGSARASPGKYLGPPRRRASFSMGSETSRPTTSKFLSAIHHVK